ncbi:MAG: alpha/beta fold hydrolase [Thermoleophilia bacterium]|nr:alpha/beta fold hydrolase [Thermoleophilia bacterium]
MTVARLAERTTSDGVVVRGWRWGAGSAYGVLVHDAGSDCDEWRPALAAFDPDAAVFVALDLRGHGASDGEWVVERAHLDVEAAVALADDAGAAFRFVVGAGVGGACALRAADLRKPDALVLLSPDPDGLEIADLRAPGVPKLVLVGSHDARRTEQAAAIARGSIGWALVAGLPTGDQGTRLLTGSAAAHAQQLIVGFLNECRYQSGAEDAVQRGSERP